MMTDQAVLDLIQQLTSLDDETCEVSAIALGQQGETGLSLLAKLLASAETDVRFWAVRGLWANGSARAVGLLIRTLQDEAEMVRSGAALALGELGPETAIEPLARLMVADSSACGNYAADALAKIGPSTTPVLIDALAHDAGWVRLRAAKALIPMESKAAIPGLLGALEDGSYLVRQYAAEALARMGVGQMLYFRD